MPNTDENKTLNNKIRKLAPEAIETMGELLREPTTPAPTKAQLIGFILERTLGTPDHRRRNPRGNGRRSGAYCGNGD